MELSEIAKREVERIHLEEKPFLVRRPRGDLDRQIGELHIIYKVAYAGRDLTEEETYVGSTHLSLRQSLCFHRKDARRDKGSSLHRFMRNLGPGNFYLVLLDSAYGAENARLLEREWKDKLNAGLNDCDPVNRDKKERESKRVYWRENRGKKTMCAVCCKLLAFGHMRRHLREVHKLPC